MEKLLRSSSSSSSDAVNSLMFGKKIYFGDMGSAGASREAPPPLSPAKKGRSGAAQPPRCQVEGCKADLSEVKAYYSRHKVCGMHSKSPKVIVAGVEQRFCQQCSRFHQLPEFDQGKRSCRRRLAGHNERRRKPQPGSLLSPHYRTTHSKTGGFMMGFSAYSTLTGKDPWPNATTKRVLENQAAITGKPELTWQGSSQNPLSDLVQATTSKPSYSGPGVSSEECFSGVSDSCSALSLLSNSRWGSKIHSSGFEASNYLATSVQPSINHDAAIDQFTCPPWVFKDGQENDTSHEIPPNLGLGQASYAGELGLAQPREAQIHQVDQSRGYDSSVHHTHWSL